MNLKTILKQIPIILFTFLISCANIPSDKKNTMKGEEVIGRLQQEAKAIDNFYFSTNFKNSLPYKSSHVLQGSVIDLVIPIVININPKLNYEKESVNDCINNIRTIGFPLGGVSTLLTCDIREAGIIELGVVSTGGRKTKKNELLLNILALP